MRRILVPFYITSETLPSETYIKLIQLYQEQVDSIGLPSLKDVLEWFREAYCHCNITNLLNYCFPTNRNIKDGWPICCEELFEEFCCPDSNGNDDLCNKCYYKTIYYIPDLERKE